MNELVRYAEGQGGLIQLDFMRLLRTPVEFMSEEEIAAAVSILTLAGAAFKEREVEVKAAVRILAEERGKRISEKTLEFAAGDVKVHVSTPDAAVEVDEPKLRVAMREASVPEDDLYDRVLVLNKKKLELALAQGRFTPEQVTSFSVEKPRTPAVSVKAHVLGLTKDELLKGRERG